MKIKYFGTALIVTIILFGGYGIFKVTGLWDDVSNKTPTKISISTSDRGQVEVLDPDSIKGSSSFVELSEWFEIPLEDLANAFEVPEDLWLTVKNRDLETLYGELELEIGNSSVKLFVSLYTSIPYEMDEEVYLPESAVDILIERGDLSTEQLTYVNEHRVVLPEQTDDTPILSEHENNTTSSGSTFEIKGKTTFQEVIAAGLSKQKIEEILDMDLPVTTAIIKDFCVENNLEYSVIKDKIIESLNELN